MQTRFFTTFLLAGLITLTALWADRANAADRHPTSYEIFKHKGARPLAIGNDNYFCFCTYVDIDGDGKYEVFVTRSRYTPSRPQNEARPSAYSFHRLSGNSLRKRLG